MICAAFTRRKNHTFKPTKNVGECVEMGVPKVYLSPKFFNPEFNLVNEL